MNGNYQGLFGIIFWIVVIVYFYKRSKKKKIEEQEKKSRKIQEDKDREEKIQLNIQNKLKKVDVLNSQLTALQDIEIVDVSDFKKVIIENESIIIEKGGDSQLFSFMKVDSFLNDFQSRILSDKVGLKEGLDIDWLKSKIKYEGERKDIDKLVERLEDLSANIGGGKTKGFEANVDKLFELGNNMKPTLESQIKTLEYYKNIALAMIVFYVSDKKIRYFEIYEAFEKMGIFDSTWQKNVLNKLERIEIRLAHMSNQLTELNQNFELLVKSSENITHELKEINSGIVSNNLLQGITAYQTWKLNKNFKNTIQ
jgi:hypothetical protein